MNEDELKKAVAASVLANPRANRTAARLATWYLEALAKEAARERGVTYGWTLVLKGGYTFDVTAKHAAWLEHLQWVLHDAGIA